MTASMKRRLSRSVRADQADDFARATSRLTESTATTPPNRTVRSVILRALGDELGLRKLSAPRFRPSLERAFGCSPRPTSPGLLSMTAPGRRPAAVR